MGYGHSTTRRARLAAGLLLASALAWCRACEQPVYLSFDTGHMAVAPLVAQVLARQQVRATFFLADEKTTTGGSALDDQWAPWWKALAQQGHVFGSHTWSHAYWSADLPAGRFRIQPSAGAASGQVQTWSSEQYCEQLRQPARRFLEMTGQPMSALFRAPGGKTSNALLAAARACGFAHVPWSAAGFLGDELPSERFPNLALLQRALRDIRAGDILLAHLGIWSRRDAWAPAVLEPLIVGLKQRGLCFQTLDQHPAYRDWVAAHPLRLAASVTP